MQIASMVKSLAKAAICTYVCMYVAHVNTCMCACHGDDDLMHVFLVSLLTASVVHKLSFPRVHI